jgi:hypothetical protein
MRTLIFSVLLFAPPALASEVVTCPETYPSSDTVIATSAYWTNAVVLGNQPLTSAGVLNGPLNLRGDLRGEETKTADGYQRNGCNARMATAVLSDWYAESTMEFWSAR